jgi:hypothetical protein
MINLQKALSYLFVSKVRVKALRYFFNNKDEKIHLRAVTRELQEEVNAVRRELLRLVEITFLETITLGNKTYYSLNKEFPFFEELLSVLSKSEGLGEEILKTKDRLGIIYFAALTTSYINKSQKGHKDIDLVIVGDVDLETLGSLIVRQEKKEDREINYTVMKLGEFNLRKKRIDPFMQKILADCQIILIGNRVDFNSVG